MTAYVKKQYHPHWPTSHFLRTNNSKMETVAEFIDESITSLMWMLFMLLLHCGRVFMAPASYPEGLCEENNYPDWSSLWYSSHNQGIFRDTISNQSTATSFYIIPNSLFTSLPLILHYLFWITDKVVK